LTPLQVAVRDFLAFGKPCEGSFRYHDAWKKLQERYEFELICPPLEDYIKKDNEGYHHPMHML